jgi:transcriptional regulator with XRE-family HTH domain
MNFSENLKAALSYKNFKQADLCRATGIPSSLISDYYNDIRKPGFDHLLNIAKALNMSIDELLIFSDKTKAPDYDPTLEELKDQIIYLIQYVPENMRQPFLDMLKASAVIPESSS